MPASKFLFTVIFHVLRAAHQCGLPNTADGACAPFRSEGHVAFAFDLVDFLKLSIADILGENNFVDVLIIMRLKASEHSDRAVLLVLPLPIWHSPLDHFSSLKVCVLVFDVVGNA